MKKTWTCRQVEPRLTDYALGELDAVDERAVLSHLEVCDDCNAEAARIAIAIELAADAFTHAPATALTSRNRPSLAATLRNWIVAPEDRAMGRRYWPGILARAALVILLPLSVVLGLAVNRLRSSGNTLADGRLAVTPPPPVEDSERVFLVNLLAVPEFSIPESLSPVSLATYSATPEGNATDAGRSPFEVAAEHWNSEGLIRNELPLGSWFIVGTNERMIDLARSTMPIMAVRLAQTNMPAPAAPTSLAMRPKIRHDGRKYLIETMAAPPGTTNRTSIISGGDPSRSAK